MPNKLKPYPTWVCHSCGTHERKCLVLCATYHMGICDVCGERKVVTQPRDFGYPKFVGYAYP